MNCLNCGKETKKDAVKFCSSKCDQELRYVTYIDRWKQGLENGMRGPHSLSHRIRKYLFEKFDSKCAKCSWSEINPVSKKIPLEVDHIDGNHRNNKEENLILICPNCHSLTPTYKALNKNGRKDRR